MSFFLGPPPSWPPLRLPSTSFPEDITLSGSPSSFSPTLSCHILPSPSHCRNHCRSALQSLVAFALQGLPALPAGASNSKPEGDAAEANQLELGSLVVSSRQGTVSGYSRSVVKVSFTPPAAGPVREQISIRFRCAAMSHQHQQDCSVQPMLASIDSFLPRPS